MIVVLIHFVNNLISQLYIFNLDITFIYVLSFIGVILTLTIAQFTDKYLESKIIYHSVTEESRKQEI